MATRERIEMDFRQAMRQADEVDEIAEAMQREMESYVKRHRLDLLVVAFTSILENGSLFFGAGALADTVTDAFPNRKDEKRSFQEDILSRKNQIVPMLTRALNNRL